MRAQYDMLWKGMIEIIMADLLIFVDPDIGNVVDMGRAFEFLDKELPEIYPDPKESNVREVDKLVKIFLRDGGETCILLHIEVQGRHGKDFPARMFEYFMRIRKSDRPVAAIAIITTGKGNVSWGIYKGCCLWTNITYEYKTLCIEDYTEEALAASPNPFAAVMLIAREALLKGQTEDELDELLLDQKLRMFRLLKEKSALFGEEKTQALRHFLYNYVVFKKPETARMFEVESNRLSGKKNSIMDIYGIMNEIKREEGRQEGREEGRQEGWQEGRQEGWQGCLEATAERLLMNNNFTVQQVVDLLGAPAELVEKVSNRLENK